MFYRLDKNREKDTGTENLIKLKPAKLFVNKPSSEFSTTFASSILTNFNERRRK